ncbi:hypothetical protein [Streptomyces sp. NPDC048057]|uniref:hypothetical protein n=1 Tax=Streptomyces sp. NPDC048057 TaxID=3155628 RepID=UPI0033FD61F0
MRVRSSNGYEERIQGPNSNSLKFAKVLCASCNNTKSQPFDLAYDAFALSIHRNAGAIVESGHIRFSRIYGKNWRRERISLAKYFVKNICCRLAEDGVRVPQMVIDYMNGVSSVLPNFVLEMNINLAKYELGKHLREVHSLDGGSLWSGGHGVIYDENQSAIGTYSHLGFDWFNLDYQFLQDLTRGEVNFFLGDVVHLERFWPDGFASGDVAKACRSCNPGVISKWNPEGM